MSNTTEEQGIKPVDRIIDDWAAIKWLGAMLLIVAIACFAVEMM